MEYTRKIAFFDTKPYDQSFFKERGEQRGYSFTFFPEKLSPHNASLADGFDAVCAFVNDDLSEEVIDRLHRGGVRLVAMRSAGYNNVDLKAAYQSIHVVRVPAYSPHAVAEHALAMMLSLNRKIHRAYYRTRDNNFSINGLLGFDMHGKTAGIIGTGKIGRTMIAILKGLGMQVMAYDPFPKPEIAKAEGFSYHSLSEIYRSSDIISLHCPLTPETHHLIDTAALKEMKAGVILINTSRGSLVDTDALLSALRDKRIGAAGLDVYEEEEEYFFEDFSNESIGDDRLARLLSFPNVLITSHQAFFTREALTKIADTTLDNLDAWFEGRDLDNEVCYRCREAECRKESEGRCF